MIARYDNLEMQLRVAGRGLAAPPDAELLERARSAAFGALHEVRCEEERRVRRRLGLVIAALVAVTLPAPLLFLWFDWTAVSSLLNSLLPAGASQAISIGLLWVKVCALVLIYGICISLLVWSANRRVFAPAAAAPRGEDVLA